MDFAPTLTSVVTPACKSRTKTSGIPFVSPTTRFAAALTNATYRPSGVIADPRQAPLPGTPARLALTSAVVLLHRSRTKTSVIPLVSPGAKSLALLSKQA